MNAFRFSWNVLIISRKLCKSLSETWYPYSKHQQNPNLPSKYHKIKDMSICMINFCFFIASPQVTCSTVRIHVVNLFKVNYKKTENDVKNDVIVDWNIHSSSCLLVFMIFLLRQMFRTLFAVDSWRVHRAFEEKLLSVTNAFRSSTSIIRKVLF